jgi:diguanylate cyclase (GGDEF)-like protein
MLGISKKTAIKASVAALLSMAVSLSAAWIVVPILGGHPDGPGFWMSAILPLAIGWPASAWQFTQGEKVRAARDQVAAMHAELERMHDELKITHAALEEKSRIDGLTGALNRDAFFARLQATVADERPLALLIADADHFKRINDDFGHQCGDDALRGIAAAIATALRPQDFWGRIGGEEFAICLDGADNETARVIADMIRLAVLSIGLRVDDEIVPVSVSIGGACATRDTDAEAAIALADRRLYEAKRAGRNRIIMDDEPQDRVAARSFPPVTEEIPQNLGGFALGKS